MRAIRLTPPDVTIDLILPTPGGLVLATEQIARALIRHPAQVTVFVPITVEKATEMGLPITVGLPRIIYELMDMYLQPQGGRPSVQYIPMPDDDRRPILPTPKGRPLEERGQTR